MAAAWVVEAGWSLSVLAIGNAATKAAAITTSQRTFTVCVAMLAERVLLSLPTPPSTNSLWISLLLAMAWAHLRWVVTLPQVPFLRPLATALALSEVLLTTVVLAAMLSAVLLLHPGDLCLVLLLTHHQTVDTLQVSTAAPQKLPSHPPEMPLLAAAAATITTTLVARHTVPLTAVETMTPALIHLHS